MNALYKRCGNCRKLKWRWFVKKREVFLPPIQQHITSQQELCGDCAHNLYKVMAQMKYDGGEAKEN